MQDFEKHKAKFDAFLDKINPNEKIGILAHSNCPDGMISTVFLVEILKRKFPSMPKPYIGFISYSKGILDKYESIFNREEIKKVFILDAGLDIDLLEELERFMSKFEVLLNDHHPVNPKLNINENIIKTIGNDCTSLVMYEFGKSLLVEKEWIELACIAAISEFSYKSEENLRFIQKHYAFESENVERFDIFKKVLRMNSLVVYYSKDSMKAYELILNRDENKIDQINKEVSDEFDRLVKDFEINAEKHFNNHLYFYFFKSRFTLGSALGTSLSVKHRGSTMVIFSEIESTNLIKVSTRNNGVPLRYPMNEMIKAGISGLEGALGAGHPPASGGSFMRKDLETFKKNIIGFVKNKLSK